MAKRNGGIIGPDNVPAGPLGAAGGVWRLEDAFNYQKAGLWPTVLGYQIPNSLRFNGGSNDYLTRTPASTSSTRTNMTFSLWVKKAVNNPTDYKVLFQTSSGGNYTLIDFKDAASGADTLRVLDSNGTEVTTTQVFRDVSAWYHIVIAIDTTQATASNRVKVYVNGSQVTSFSTATYPSQNATFYWGTNVLSGIGRHVSSAPNNFDGYLSEVYWIDGQTKAVTDFGETDSTTGIWIPKAYAGTYGTNGFYLKFANSAALGTDSSGNGNTWTVNNLTSVDQSYDSPTNNFCTLNAVQTPTYAALSEGNLVTAGTDNKGCACTFGVNKGKWYWEVKTVGSTGLSQRMGVSNRANEQDGDASPTGDTANIRSFCGQGAYKNYSASSAVSDASFISTNGTIYGFALDLNAGTLGRYVNGTLINTDTTLPSDNSVTFFPFTFVTFSGGSGWNQSQFNFGYPPYAANSYADANGFGNFSYAVPSGYYSLCTKNLALYG